MNIQEIRVKYRAGELAPKEALELLGKLYNKPGAAELISEILSIPEEPKAMTDEERVVAERWENNHRE